MHESISFSAVLIFVLRLQLKHNGSSTEVGQKIANMKINRPSTVQTYKQAARNRKAIVDWIKKRTIMKTEDHTDVTISDPDFRCEDEPLEHDVPLLPSTLRPGPPCGGKTIVPPGKCQFGSEPIEVTLLARTQVSPSEEIGSSARGGKSNRISSVLRFSLPDPSQALNLSTCACLVAIANIDGQEVRRPYTPISTNRQVGTFDLLVRHYGPTAKMSRYLHDVLQPGDKIAFVHTPENVKVQAHEFMNAQHIGMLVGGAGITPMLQALHAILGGTQVVDQTSTSTTLPRVTLLYGNHNANDILGRHILESWARDYPDRFQLVHILSREPEGTSWTGHRGLISWELIEEHFPDPYASSNSQVWICGPDGMYDEYTGPRSDPQLSGLLSMMGYKASQVYKF